MGSNSSDRGAGIAGGRPFWLGRSLRQVHASLELKPRVSCGQLSEPVHADRTARGPDAGTPVAASDRSPLVRVLMRLACPSMTLRWGRTAAERASSAALTVAREIDEVRWLTAGQESSTCL